MAWNTTNKKALDGAESKAAIGPGAPVAQNPSFAGKAYRDPWDIERAYREGVQKVTWVARCIDAIAGNQARLPIILRKDNSPVGEIVKRNSEIKNSFLPILNTKSNIGENSFIFRYRLSSQLLMSTRGAFIEKIRGRDGRLIGLNLLPPQSTAPIPDAKKFVAGYEVLMPNGDKVIMKAEDVVWVRRPHPLDPYLSMTPMEAAGIAIEIENLAKVYNRNFLLNDGRPGGLLVVRGEIDDDDKNELRSRFRGNLGKAGATTVISADDGVDFVDTSASPRDAAYIQMRQITKEEILASFGVPESVIGNASGRTFSNAGEEIRVFWSETMMPHLEPIARALDELDEKYYVDFDVFDVPSLVMYRQERHRYVLQEFQTGLISANEYRDGTGRKTVKSDLADSLLQNPNLTPIANTEKEMEQPSAQMPGMPGMPPGAPGMPPGMPGAEALGMQGAPGGGMPPDAGMAAPDMTTMQGAMAAESMQGAPATGAAPIPPGQASDTSFLMNFKSPAFDSDLERWTEIFDRSLERILERQQRVILEKANGQKCKKLLADGMLDVESIMAIDVWDRQIEEDIRPVVNSIVKDAVNISAKSANYVQPLPEDIIVNINALLGRIKEINAATRDVLASEIKVAMSARDPEHRATILHSGIISHFTQLMAKSKQSISSIETRRAWMIAI